MKVDAEAAGMDGGRLARIDEHLRARYLEPGKIAGCQVAVVRRGALAHFSSLGFADRERQIPVAEDTMWRIYSMTKPITGVALMSLYERGLFQLTDDVAKCIPGWRDLRVAETAEDGSRRLVEPRRPMQVRDLLMHMAGLGYGRDNADLDLGPIGDRGAAPSVRTDHDLESMVARLAGSPLRFHPGTRWLYSLGTDVCGRLVEILSGRRFDDYLATEVFGPLGMTDTGFSVPATKAGRLAASYARNSRKELVLVDDPAASPYLSEPTLFSGGGGLVSTTPDYLRFCQMMLGGGELDGRRVLGRKTMELMTINHLPGGGQLGDFALPGGYGEVGFDGMGFGLTMAVGQGPARTGVVGSAGEYMWGGAASTAFWVDPAEELIVVFMTQLLPSGTFDFRAQLKALVYAAIAD
ncbi:MAG: serine hydrolase domain-containing protein [Acidimicrobiales bacterium]